MSAGYIEIFDNAVDMNLLATINNPVSAKAFSSLEYERTLTFTVAVDNDELAVDAITPIWKLLATTLVAKHSHVDNEIFDIVRRERIREPDGGLVVFCECEHISYRLNDKVYVDTIFENKTALEMMTDIFSGTGLQGTVHPSISADTYSFQFTNMTARAALMEVATAWSGELKANDLAVNLISALGSTVDTAPVTAGLNLQGIRDVVDARDEEAAGVSGRVNVAELKEITEFGADYEFILGDLITVTDSDLDVNTNVRIVAYEYDIKYPMRSMIELATRWKNMVTTFYTPMKEDTDKIPGLESDVGDLNDGFNSLTDILTSLEDDLDDSSLLPALPAPGDSTVPVWDATNEIWVYTQYSVMPNGSYPDNIHLIWDSGDLWWKTGLIDGTLPPVDENLMVLQTQLGVPVWDWLKWVT